MAGFGRALSEAAPQFQKFFSALPLLGSAGKKETIGPGEASFRIVLEAVVDGRPGLEWTS